jgi:hypothetical protein
MMINPDDLGTEEKIRFHMAMLAASMQHFASHSRALRQSIYDLKQALERKRLDTERKTDEGE